MKAVFKDPVWDGNYHPLINLLRKKTELNLVAPQIKHWFFKIKNNVCWQESRGWEAELKFT